MNRRRVLVSRWIDRQFKWIKWPVAVLTLAFLPGAVGAMAELLLQVGARPMPVAMFLVGFAVYGVLWWRYFRRSAFSLILTLEHELTHALFAILTFHRVTDLRATAFRGGHVKFLGEGNWLITISPYFFPTLSLTLLIVLAFLPDFLGGFAHFLIGLSFAYHVTSTLRETHPGQTDLQRVGGLFCFLFLPTANIVALGTLLGFVYGGWQGSARFLASIWLTTWDFFH